MRTSESVRQVARLNNTSVSSGSNTHKTPLFRQGRQDSKAKSSELRNHQTISTSLLIHGVEGYRTNLEGAVVGTHKSKPDNMQGRQIEGDCAKVIFGNIQRSRQGRGSGDLRRTSVTL